MINDLLAFSDIAQGRLVLRKSPTDLAALIRETAALCARVCSERKVKLEFELKDGLPILELDPDHVRLAIKHLILNAALFNNEGGVIRVGAALEKDNVHLWFADTGIGLDAEVVPKLFGSFYQAADLLTRKVGGLGLGLAIVKGIVEGHGGWVKAESAAGGSVFHVLFPIEGVKGG